MTTSKQGKPRPTGAGPDRLSKAGRKSGVELSGSELGQVSGGAIKLVDGPKLAT